MLQRWSTKTYNTNLQQSQRWSLKNWRMGIWTWQDNIISVVNNVYFRSLIRGPHCLQEGTPTGFYHSGRPRPVWWLWWRCPWGQDFLGEPPKVGLPGRRQKKQQNCEDPMGSQRFLKYPWWKCLGFMPRIVNNHFAWTSIAVVDILMLAATKTYYWLLLAAFSSDYFCCKLSIGNSKMSSLASKKLL